MEYSAASESEYSELVDFWNRNAGWDQLTLEDWGKRFLITPGDPPVFVIGRDNGKILGHIIFLSFKIILGDKNVKGCRPFAAIVDNSVKGLSGYRIIIQLFNFGIRYMENQGIDLLIMLPDPRWKPLSKFINISFANFPLYKRNIHEMKETLQSINLSVRPGNYDTPALDNLWEEVKKQGRNMICRDRESLKWKNSHRDYKIIEVINKDKLIGIATYIEKATEKQIQICDLLYSHESERKEVLEQVSCFLGRLYKDDNRFEKIVILVTECLKESLIDIGYVADNYQFLFVVKSLNKSISKRALNISQWYLSAND
jgi:hypothetical protein